jgi:hypothetical protein
VIRTKTWRWCIRRKHPENSHRKVSAVFGGGRVRLIASTLPRHRAGEIAPDMPASDLRGVARPLGHGLWGQRTLRGSEFIYGTRRGRVSFTGVTKRSIAERPGALLALVKRSRIR